MSLKGKSLISITDYTKKEWLDILKLAAKFEKRPNQSKLKGKVVATLFFEPSTRTRLSFEAAAQRLGASVISFSDAQSTSVAKGESLKDTIRMASGYADLIVMRHPLDGSARLASEFASVPIINGGDGVNQHPTQTLLDLYSIQKTQRKLDGLTIAFGGDLRYNRTALTLIRALCSFDTRFIFVSPPQLAITEDMRYFLEEEGAPFTETDNLRVAIESADILYVNRIQKERFADPLEYEAVKDQFVIDTNAIAKTKKNFKIMHALPRINEITEDVDDDPRAYYFEQAKNGIPVRQAILASILGATK